MVCTPLQGMDQCPVDVKKIILWHAGRRAQKMFAQVSQANNKFMEEHCRARKKIKELMAAKGTPIIPEQVSWNNDFSKCAWSEIQEGKGKFGPKILKIIALSLCDQKNLVIAEAKWNNYIQSLEGLEDLFFNKNGAACCYSYGYRKVIEDINKDDVFEYSLQLDGKQDMKRCVVSASTGTGVLCDLQLVLHIPAVMKAFLQSPYTIVDMGDNQPIKFYNLNEVIMPQEYEEYGSEKYWNDQNAAHDDGNYFDYY